MWHTCGRKFGLMDSCGNSLPCVHVHAATACGCVCRYVVLFGGGSAATVTADVHVLDTAAEGGPAWLNVALSGATVRSCV
jgi:hypothetical protein